MKNNLRALYQKIGYVTASFVLAVSTLTAAVPFVLSQRVSALSPVVNITSVAELRSAVENQADNQVWTIQPGSYGLSPFDGISQNGQTGWYLPITADNLTINGVGNPMLYGTGYTANGNHSTQNFVSVFGDNVVIDGVTLMPKVEPNKTVEVMGANFTLRNTIITPNTLVDPSEYASAWAGADQWGGSLYFSHEGSHNVENVTIKNSGISYRYAPSGTTINFTNTTLEYTTAEDWINTYRYSTGFNNGGNATTGSINVVYRVSAALGNLNSVLAAVQDGDTILLDSDLTVTEQITLNKAVTLDGNGYTIDGAFVKSGNSNNSVVGIQSDNVTVRNLGVTSSADQPWPLQLHGLNIYNSENVTLNTVQAHDLEGSGIVVSQGSIVSASNISTANNGWHGINVDKPGAHLTIYGTSQHSEVAPDIYVDNVTVGQVTDVDGQYATNDDVLQTGDRVYNLKLQTPVLESPLDNGYTNTNNFYFEWADVSGAVSYEFQNSQTDAVNLDGSLTAVHYSSTSTDSQLHSVGAPDGTVRYWQVRAVDALGVKSDWSDVWKMTIDMTAPDATVLTSPSDGAVVHGASVTQSWSTTDTDVGHYIYESYHDEAMEDLRWHQEVSGTSKTATNVGDSAYWWRVKAVDNAGNEGEWSDTWKLTIDSTKPYVEITSPTDELNSTDVEVRVTATDENLRHYWVKITRDGVVVYNNTLISGSVVNELVYTATEDGDYVVTLAARDTVGGGSSTGNRSEDVVKMFTVDATDPVVEIDNVVVSTDKMLSFDVSGTDNLSGSRTVGVNIYNEDNTGAAIIGIGRLAHDIVPGTLSVGPYGVIDIDVSGLVSGTYTIRAAIRDWAGNLEYATEQFDVDNDPIINYDGFNSDNNVITPIITVDDEDTTSYLWTYVSGPTGGVVVSNDIELTPDFTVSEDGTYEYLLTATDVAGNTSTLTFTFTYEAPTEETPAAPQGGEGDDAPAAPQGPFTDVGVLGDTDEADTDATDQANNEADNQTAVESATDDNTDGDDADDNGTIFGLAWYWWLLILAALGTAGWWIAGALRRRNEDA